MAQFPVRDRREKGYFTVDDIYLNGWAKKLGPFASCVYISLCRHADKDEKCWPSIQLMAQELSMSAPSVIKSIKKLEMFRIITVERSTGGNKYKENNTYWLNDKRVWTDDLTSKPALPVNELTSKPDAEERVKDVYIKDTHRKETHIPLEGFEEFWGRYPKKKARKQAEKAWMKLRPSLEVRLRIDAALERCGASEDWIKDGGKYIPYPATWLNQERWEDEFEVPLEEKRPRRLTAEETNRLKELGYGT